MLWNVTSLPVPAACTWPATRMPPPLAIAVTLPFWATTAPALTPSVRTTTCFVAEVRLIEPTDDVTEAATTSP